MGSARQPRSWSWGARWPDTGCPNYADGVIVSFALLDFVSIRAKQSMERQNEMAEMAGYEQVLQTLTGKHAKALATAQGASRVAENTPIQLSAARETEGQHEPAIRPDWPR